ncbi:MAG: 50S ribosomal protein L10 [Candidatus Marinimicrobia bacterium]|nr:50S ribosomal protein L10 [Candidatus Neomarinimicrobiota bacterium]MBL7109948.1 50S ribosomal protein L10 [Candidatus Neomarinimicrobiota bacterium]
MPTPQKITIVEETQKRFEESVGIYFTNYSGLNVVQATELRDMFREKDVEYLVTKNTLTNIAAKNAGYKGLDDVLQGQISIAYSKDDPSSPARVIKEFGKKYKDNNPIEVVGILFEGKQFEADKFKELADLPTRKELISQFVGCLNQPMTKLAATLNSVMTDFVGVLNSLKDKKS